MRDVPSTPIMRRKSVAPPAAAALHWPHDGSLHVHLTAHP
jgi:hypothetical protein